MIRKANYSVSLKNIPQTFQKNVKPKAFNQFHGRYLACEMAFGFLIHTLTRLCTLILASVCISLI